MSKSAKKAADQAEREKVHKRYSNRREPDVIYPARKQVDFYDADVHQRVAVYVRVSTDNLGQETSYELQKNYYEEFVLKHPNWSLVKIYADKGISGTSTKHRVALNQMLADSRAGKIDLIITKSVSRLARNTVDCITMVRNLAELRNPVGVFFESECIFSLNEDTSMPLSFLASIAENESRIRSRSMEVSLAQRLNGGLPLTPKLLGYSHDTDGKLVINPDEAPTVKLIFYMYLSGYSSAYIAKTLEELGKTTFLGNTKWTSNTVIQILRNERHGVESLEACRALFEPYVCRGAEQILPQYRAQDSSWTPFSSLPVVLVYNPKLLSSGQLSCWADLLDPALRGQIAFADPSVSGSSYTALVTMLCALGGDADEVLQTFAENLDGKLLSGSGAIISAVANGEALVGITLEETARKRIAAGDGIAMVYPADGTSCVPDGCAALKGAPHPDNAKLFLDFAVSYDVQQLLQSDFYRRPVRSDVSPASKLPELSAIRQVAYDVSWASEHREAILMSWAFYLGTEAEQ